MGASATLDFRRFRLGALGGVFVLAAGLLALLNGESVGPATTTDGTGSVEATVAKLPLSFEPNSGRTDPRVDFLARSVAGGTLYLSAREAVLQLPVGKKGTRALGLGLVGSAPGADPRGVGELPGKVNSFIGDDPARWRSGIPTYSRVRYESVYPGIDLDYYGNQRRLEYDFRLAAGADPERIALRLRGADSLRLAPNGDLVIGAGKAAIRQRVPVAFQTIAGQRRAVDASYEIHGSTVGFRLGRYDRSRPLTIDPLVLAYSTYLGGSGFDAANTVAVDSSGAAYVGGVARASGTTPFPTQDAFQGTNHGGFGDAFVAKLNPDRGGGVSLAYSTYLGGAGNEQVHALAIDSAGAVYITGPTDSSGGSPFPTQDPLAGMGTNQGGSDAFLTKLNPDSGGAVTLAYSTYLGGGADDDGNGIDVDSAGAVYLTGDTESSGGTPFPTADPFQATNGGLFDSFVTKINPDPGGATAPTINYSTYLGGGADDFGNGIAIDSSGAAYVAGYTESSGGTPFPTQNDFQGSNQGGPDWTVTKINPHTSGNLTLAYSTYLGGSGTDYGAFIAVDSAGAAYLSGQTQSTNFPTQDAFQADQPGNDAAVAKLNPDSGAAVTLAYSTYLGGGDSDQANNIALDGTGAAYVTGTTSSDDPTPFPTTADALQGANAGANDVFATKLNPDTGGAVSLGYSTYLGGGSSEGGGGIAVDSSGAIYLAGLTQSTGTTAFPTQDPFQATNHGDRDVFVTRLAEPITCSGKVANLFGTAGKDTITGTSGKDVIAALGGNDTVKGRGKKDVVCGGDGKDKLVGGKGDDTLLGEAGKDTLKGEAGKDTLKGAGGNDTLKGGAGKDKLKGGSGRDTCIGGGGRDRASSCAKRRSI